MNRQYFKLIALLFCGALTMTSDTGSLRARHEYELGKTLAHELFNNGVAFECQIVEVLNGVSPASPQAPATRLVKVKVSQWLTGRRSVEQSFDLQVAAPPASGKVSEGPWSPWQGVSLTIGERLFVVRGTKESAPPAWGGDPDAVRLVTSDSEATSKLAELAASSDQFRGDANFFQGLIPLAGKEPVTSGFLITYLIERPQATNADATSDSLSRILADRNIPNLGTSAIVDWITGTAYRLSPASLADATDALAAAAASDDLERARLGFRGLWRLSQEPATALHRGYSPAQLAQLAKRYEQFVRSGELPAKNAEFESQLGLGKRQ